MRVSCADLQCFPILQNIASPTLTAFDNLLCMHIKAGNIRGDDGICMLPQDLHHHADAGVLQAEGQLLLPCLGVRAANHTGQVNSSFVCLAPRAAHKIKVGMGRWQT